MVTKILFGHEDSYVQTTVGFILGLSSHEATLLKICKVRVNLDDCNAEVQIFPRYVNSCKPMGGGSERGIVERAAV